MSWNHLAWENIAQIIVQRRSGFGPTPSPILPNFRRLTTIECEKGTPVNDGSKRVYNYELLDLRGESLEARAGIEPAHKGFADLAGHISRF